MGMFISFSGGAELLVHPYSMFYADFEELEFIKWYSKTFTLPANDGL